MAKKRTNSPVALCVGLIFATVLAGAGCAHQPVVVDVEPSPYICKSASGPIVVDGCVSETAWQTAEVVTNFYACSPKDATDLSPTEVRVLWDSDNLYVAITCADVDIWSYSEQSDSELWNGDVGEFFMKPDRDSPVYYEFVIAPNGTLYDARYPSRGAGGFQRFKTWSSGAQVAAVVNGTDDNATDMDAGYTIEMAIPLSAFHGSTPPAEGATWSFGAFRYDYSKRFEEPLLLMSIPESKRGFHYYEGYADLVFEGILETR